MIIDAGSFGIDRNQQRSKGDINTMILRKFWCHAVEKQAANPQLKQLWCGHHQLQACLDDAAALLHRSYLDHIHVLMVVRQSGLHPLVGSTILHYIG